MKLSLFVGDIVDAPAEALCTSTNPRLSLMMGTGGAVRERGGYEILRACEAIAERGDLPPGSVHATTAGNLPAKMLIHCVASDAGHRSSADVVRACVTHAIAVAVAAGCRSIAMPVFASGHASLGFNGALLAMAEALREADVEHVIIVVYDGDRVEDARKLLATAFPASDIHVEWSTSVHDDVPRMWADE